MQGTRDPFGTREEVAGYRAVAGDRVLWLEDGDHDLRPRKARVGVHRRRSTWRRWRGRSAEWAGGWLPRLMRIATFNVNNVVKRLGNLLDWLAEAAPDVVCLQELKAADGGLSGGGAGGGGLRRGLARAAGVERGRDPRRGAASRS